MPEFRGFPKIPRLEKFLSGMIVTEKIDGTNGCVVIDKYEDHGEGNPPELIIAWADQDGVTWGMFAQSRNRLLAIGDDNYGFCQWVSDHCEELKELGHGYHYGEWWGNGIQRNYGLDEKRFSLFNVNRPGETLPECCHQVPVVYKGEFSHDRVKACADTMKAEGSLAAPGFMDPEGLMLWLPGVRQYVKHPFDPKHKGKS